MVTVDTVLTTDLEGNSEFKACLPYKTAETAKHPESRFVFDGYQASYSRMPKKLRLSFSISRLFPSRKGDHPGIDRISEGPEHVQF